MDRPSISRDSGWGVHRVHKSLCSDLLWLLQLAKAAPALWLTSSLLARTATICDDINDWHVVCARCFSGDTPMYGRVGTSGRAGGLSRVSQDGEEQSQVCTGQQELCVACV